MFTHSRRAPTSAQPHGARPSQRTFSSAEVAIVARAVALANGAGFAERWQDDQPRTDRDESAVASAARGLDTARAARGSSATEPATTGPRSSRPIPIDAYRRALTACPACGTRLTAADLCHGCNEQWWRCQDLALAVDLPPGYLTGLIAIGWLPAVQTLCGAWIRQRDAERVIASFAALPDAPSGYERRRARAARHLVPVPSTESPHG